MHKITRKAGLNLRILSLNFGSSELSCVLYIIASLYNETKHHTTKRKHRVNNPYNSFMGTLYHVIFWSAIQKCKMLKCFCDVYDIYTNIVIKGLKCRGQILYLSNTTGGSAICGTDGRTRTGRIFQRFKFIAEISRSKSFLTFFQNEFRFTPEIFLYSRGVNLKLRVLDYSLA